MHLHQQIKLIRQPTAPVNKNRGPEEKIAEAAKAGAIGPVEALEEMIAILDQNRMNLRQMKSKKTPPTNKSLSPPPPLHPGILETSPKAPALLTRTAPSYRP